MLRGYAEKTAAGEHRDDNRRIVFRFCTSPIEITGTEKVETIVLGRNELFTDEHGRATAKDTGLRETLPAQLVVRAVGYRGVAIPGLPFDDRSGTIPHTEGRIDGRDNDYVVGWIKRGPSGVIGTNKSDSQDTVNTLAADLRGKQPREAGPGYAGTSKRTGRLAAAAPAGASHRGHWQLIDAHERGAGEPHGRPGSSSSTSPTCCASVTGSGMTIGGAEGAAMRNATTGNSRMTIKRRRRRRDEECEHRK